MTILNATAMRERGIERGKGKTHKDPLVNLIKKKITGHDTSMPVI